MEGDMGQALPAVQLSFYDFYAAKKEAQK